MIDINDSEIQKIERVINTLRERTATPRDYSHFENEIKDRFWDIGFRVDVKWWSTNVDGTLIPDIEILERIEGKFDPDRQVHEVVNNILELPDQQTGFIKTSPKEIDMLKTGQINPKDKNAE